MSPTTFGPTRYVSANSTFATRRYTIRHDKSVSLRALKLNRKLRHCFLRLILGIIARLQLDRFAEILCVRLLFGPGNLKRLRLLQIETTRAEFVLGNGNWNSNCFNDQFECALIFWITIEKPAKIYLFINVHRNRPRHSSYIRHSLGGLLRVPNLDWSFATDIKQLPAHPPSRLSASPRGETTRLHLKHTWPYLLGFWHFGSLNFQLRFVRLRVVSYLLFASVFAPGAYQCSDDHNKQHWQTEQRGLAERELLHNRYYFT